MPPSIPLHQLSTRLQSRISKTVRHSFRPLSAQLDCIEYCLGLKRGGIEEVSSNLLVAYLQDDMVSLLKDGQWTLLPPPGMLQKIRDLYRHNHDKGTFSRRHFLEAIPEEDYEYHFLCLSPPHDRQWLVDGVEYPFPLRDFPLVRTRIHPCFLFPSIMSFIINGPSDESHLKPMRDVVDVCDEINLTRIRSVYVSWLLEGGEFPERMTPFARPDLRRHLTRPKQPAPGSQDSAVRRPAGTKRVKITSPQKPITKQAGSSAKKGILKASSSSKATVPRKPQVKKRKVFQLSNPSVEEDLPSKRRRSPRFAHIRKNDRATEARAITTEATRSP